MFSFYLFLFIGVYMASIFYFLQYCDCFYSPPNFNQLISILLCVLSPEFSRPCSNITTEYSSCFIPLFGFHRNETTSERIAIVIKMQKHFHILLLRYFYSNIFLFISLIWPFYFRGIIAVTYTTIFFLFFSI